MIKEFSYPLPDELYINSFDLGKEFSAIYDGPEKIEVLVDNVTNQISGVNPESYNEDYYELFEIDSTKNPEISYFIMHPNDACEYEYEDEIMENGDIYKKILNPFLHDAYTLEYNHEKNQFELKLIVKTSDNNVFVSSLLYFKNRLNFILSHEEGKKLKNEEPGVSDEDLKSVEEFVEVINTTIENNLMFPSWKYTNFETILESIVPFPDNIKELLNTYE